MPQRLSRVDSRELTRRRLLDAAAEVFAKRGYAGASLEEIAETAGYTRGAVYANFAGKEELFLVLLEEAHTEGAHTWARAFDEHATLADRLRAGAEAGGESGDGGETAQRQRLVMLSLEFLLQGMRNERARTSLADLQHRNHRLTAELIQRQLDDDGTTPPMPVDDLAWAVLALETGLAVTSSIDPTAGPPPGLYPAVLARLLGVPAE